jgi:CO/xanthine dehydrogenase FAD-binding subunit
VDQACALLAADDGARAIAGGQTLVPMMAMRLARPARLIDINRIAALSYIRRDGASVGIGATTRQSVIECDALVATDVPLLARAVPSIGHPATRARGTVGGSLANADPAAELALIAVVLDAVLSYRVGDDSAEVSAGDFFVGLMTTSLPGGGCVLGVRFPVWPDHRIGVGFHEVSARRSDFAFASAAAQVSLDADGACKRIAIGVGAITDFPIRLSKAEQQLAGSALEVEAVETLVRDELAGLDTLADLHASAAYRRRAAATLATRAVADALQQAQTRKAHAH